MNFQVQQLLIFTPKMDQNAKMDQNPKMDLNSKMDEIPISYLKSFWII